MKRIAVLAALAVVTVAGFAPAKALSPQRALASAAGAVTSTSAPGGTKLWAASYRDHTQGNYPNAVVASPDGSTVFVTGGSGQAHFTTVAYNAATGARRWVARFYGLGHSQPLSNALSPDGSELFVVGYSESAGFAVPGHLVIVAYNAGTGAMLWVQHPFNRNSVATSAAVSPDGSTLYVTGVVANRSGTGGYVATFAYDAATGTRRWQASYRGSLPSNTTQAVAASPDGREVFVVGPVKDASGSPFIVTLAYGAATGAALWTRIVKGTTGERNLAVSPDGSAVFVAGTVTGSAGGSSFMTVAYRAATGARLWQQSYQGPRSTSAANALTVGPDGRDVFVTGSSTDGGSGPVLVDYATVGYDAASGSQLWARSYQPSSVISQNKDGAVAAGVSTDGSLVFVTGTTPGFRSDSVNFTTIAAETSPGAASWIARYRGRRDFGKATDIAVSPAGQAVFVTGFVGVHDGCCDFGTVAYQP